MKEKPLSIRMVTEYMKRQLKDNAAMCQDVAEYAALSDAGLEGEALHQVVLGQLLRDPDLPLALRQEFLRQAGQSSYSG